MRTADNTGEQQEHRFRNKLVRDRPRQQWRDAGKERDDSKRYELGFIVIERVRNVGSSWREESSVTQLMPSCEVVMVYAMQKNCHD